MYRAIETDHHAKTGPASLIKRLPEPVQPSVCIGKTFLQIRPACSVDTSDCSRNGWPLLLAQIDSVLHQSHQRLGFTGCDLKVGHTLAIDTRGPKMFNDALLAGYS